MSFYPFGPLPTPPRAPISGLPGLETAIRHLEATPASRDAGATRPAASPSVGATKMRPPVAPPETAALQAGSGACYSATPQATLAERAAAPSGTAWLALESLLAEIDPDARPWLRRAFARTLEAVEDDLALPPPRRRLVPVPYLVQHLGRPRFQTDEPRQQDHTGLRRLLREALWRAVDALEAAALLPVGNVYQPLLAEQCAQLGRVYQVLKRRAGRCFALEIFQGELRLLHHRGSRPVESLLFG